jgi:hypothetical protein
MSLLPFEPLAQPLGGQEAQLKTDCIQEALIWCKSISWPGRMANAIVKFGYRDGPYAVFVIGHFKMVCHFQSPF